MKKFVLASVCLALAALAVGRLTADDEDKDPLEGVKCLVSGKDINPDASVDYRDGKIYFCCQNCPKAYEKDKAKFAAKANYQLVATHQYHQVKCPMSGGKLNDATAIEVSGVDVAFCCPNCKKKAVAEKDDAQIELLFNDKSFEKGFELVKEEAAAK